MSDFPTQLLINGQWIDGSGAKRLVIVNPATEEVIATVQAAGKEDIDDAVAAATEAFKTFKKSNACVRRSGKLHKKRLKELRTFSRSCAATALAEFSSTKTNRRKLA